jgi:hypothetical protein
MKKGSAKRSIPSPAILWCLLALVQGYVAQQAYAVNDGVRTISGIVDEVLANEAPPVIMVRSRPGMKDEITVGAVVKKETSIVRGKQRIALSHIRAGERVTLTYVKHRDGLTVRSITVYSK